MDTKPVHGLAGTLSNVFKLAEVEGLKWVRYIGPNSTSLESPKDDPVLTSYAKLLNEGYACSWSRLSPSTDGVSGEGKDLWIFYFTNLPDLSGILDTSLKEESVGSWESVSGMSSESSSMLFRALNGLIERSLLAENFLPLGKWFARADTTMGSDGRGCFLCHFSFFIYAHLFICASVDVKAGPALSPLLSSHLQQALASSSGTQVILSPSGVNAIMTGHSYQITDPGIEELLEEWKLFYPLRFTSEATPTQLPAAVEVVMGGVRLRYPSQFVFVYHSEGSFPTPPTSPMDDSTTEHVIHNCWEQTSCTDPILLQRDCESCHCTCKEYSSNPANSNVNKPSRPHRLTDGDTKSKRFRTGHPTDNATPMREHSSLSSTLINTQRKHLSVPKYAPSLPSPAVIKSIPSFPAPPVTQQQPPPVNNKTNNYDLSRVVDIMSNSNQSSCTHYNKRDSGWWECVSLPESVSSLLAPVSSPWLPLHIPNSPTTRKSVPIRRVKSNVSDEVSPRKRSVTGRSSKATRVRSHEVVGPPVVLPQSSFQEDTLEGNISIYDSTTGTINDDMSLSIKPSGSMDFTSASAVKISGDLGSFTSLFDDSEEEDEKMNGNDNECDTKTGSNRKTHKLFVSEIPPDLSHIYPTPPSVETNYEKCDDKTLCIEEKNEAIEMNLLSKLCPIDDVSVDIIPDEFRPINGLVSCQQMKQYTYNPNTSSNVNNNVTDTVTPSTSIIKSEAPQKFIFPPPKSFIKPSTLSLSNEVVSSPLLSSFVSSPLRTNKRHHYSLGGGGTPLESPFDANISTPMCSRVMPLLPEAHALYISLALLDSALAANVSDNVAIDFSAFQNFMLIKRNSWRTQLDSVSSSVSTPLPTDQGGEKGDNIFKLEDEKPLMMIGIADYPSLGFKEDVIVTTPHQSSSSSSYFTDNENSSVFLSMVQDYCLHLCLTGKEEYVTPSLPRQSHSKQSCRLYHTHSVSSAITCGKYLVNKPVTNKPLPTQPSLDKEDNSAAWILDLLALPNKFVTKKLRELRGVFQSSFHHAPCIKVSTKGPLSLRDLNSLTPNTSHVDDCLPLPMQPLIVGYEQEWISVSPLAVPTWDKLLFEPYSSTKHILYMVVSNGYNDINNLKNFFKNVNVAYKSLRLGVHVPLDKGGWENGIIIHIKNEDDNNETHSSLESTCSNTIRPFLEGLKDHESIYDETSYEIPPSKAFSNATPHFIVIYVVVKNEGIVQVMKTMSSLLLSNELLPDAVKGRIILQPLEESELIGPHVNSPYHLRSLVFSLFSRCCPLPDLYTDFHHLTNFGPISVRPKSTTPVKLYSPLYILSTENCSSQQLFGSEESTLFCSYCVTCDKRWLVTVVCDREGEMLDTSIIGISPNDIECSISSKYQALQKLWLYLISKVSNGVLKWNIVISRLGKPSSAEIREWQRVICNDGLMTANQLLKNDCDYCTRSSNYPYIKNVIIVSVQPERNIQLFPTNDSVTYVSHVLVLPAKPNSLPVMTEDNGGIDTLMMEDEFDTTFPAMDGIHDDDLFSGLKDMELDIHVTNFKEDVRAPLATGYLISTAPTGTLPNEFWGHDRPQSTCNMFKTLLHCHLSVNAFPGNPPDVLRSILLSFDALSWLSINHETQQRNSSLPIHLFLLSKLYNFFTHMSSR